MTASTVASGRETSVGTPLCGVKHQPGQWEPSAETDLSSLMRMSRVPWSFGGGAPFGLVVGHRGCRVERSLIDREHQPVLLAQAAGAVQVHLGAVAPKATPPLSKARGTARAQNRKPAMPTISSSRRAGRSGGAMLVSQA